MRARTITIALCCAALPTVATTARPVTYSLPAERVPTAFTQSDSDVVVSNCSACHSLDYLSTQPRHKGPQFWRDEVAKMVNVYKAPIEPADADAAAAVLAKKFG